VKAVAERMGHHLVGHHRTMPGVSKPAQAVVATRRLEDGLHSFMMAILPSLCKTMAQRVQLGRNACTASDEAKRVSRANRHDGGCCGESETACSRSREGPPDRGQAQWQRGPLYLPFVGDQTLAIILSKVLLLTADSKITDATIFPQSGIPWMPAH
jgi:hypothetical protein